MGLRFHRSIHLGGGFQINMSKSGIGYSWGNGKFRLTKTANGRLRRSYILPNGSYSRDTKIEDKTKQKERSENETRTPSAEYQKLASLIRTYQIVLVAIPFVAVALSFLFQLPYFLLLLIAELLAGPLFQPKLTYEFDDSQQKIWNDISGAWEQVASCDDLRQVLMTAKMDKTSNSGLSKSMKTAKITADHKLPWYIKSNVTPIVFHLDQYKMAVMPDRFLFFDKKMGMISGSEIGFTAKPYGFLTGGPVPKDTQVVEYRWQYVNPDGTKNEEVENNVQCPLMRYSQITLKTEGGLNIQLLCSNEQAGSHLKEVIEKYNGSAK